MDCALGQVVDNSRIVKTVRHTLFFLICAGLLCSLAGNPYFIGPIGFGLNWNGELSVIGCGSLIPMWIWCAYYRKREPVLAVVGLAATGFGLLLTLLALFSPITG